MTTTRQSLAGKLKIGTWEAWAKSLSGGGTRRLAGQKAIGVDGETFEDLGEDARRETMSAELDENEWQKLDNLRRAAKIYTITHPLFGTFQGRIVSCPYQAGLRDMVDAEITLVEDGEPTSNAAAVTITLPAAAQAYKAQKAAYDDASTDWDGLAIPASTDSSKSSFDSAMSDFDAQVDSAREGDASWEDLSSVYDDLGSTGGTFLDSLDELTDSALDVVNDVLDLGMDSLTYAVIDAARTCIGAATDQVTNVWRTLRTTTPVSVAELAVDWLGSDDDDSIDAILAANPQIVDLNYVPTGIELQLPVPA
jgi:prophage DNA circulation protein